MLSMPTTHTQKLNALTRADVTELLVNVLVSLTMKELLAKDPFALIDAVMLVFASLKNNWQKMLVANMPPLGMLKSK
jgi:hypothetical protein